MSKMIQTGKWKRQKTTWLKNFMILLDTLESNGFIHYELSNFGKQNYFSKNNRLLVGKNIWVLDRRTVIMAFLEVGMYRTTSSI
jgi:coproporphyrinogen III oxidase-like Fe-S oxidoreductase